MVALPDKLYFRLDEVASICEVSLRTVRRWTEDKEKPLKHVHLGGVARVSRESLLAWLEGQKGSTLAG